MNNQNIYSPRILLKRGEMGAVKLLDITNNPYKNSFIPIFELTTVEGWKTEDTVEAEQENTIRIKTQIKRITSSWDKRLPAFLDGSNAGITEDEESIPLTQAFMETKELVDFNFIPISHTLDLSDEESIQIRRMLDSHRCYKTAIRLTLNLWETFGLDAVDDWLKGLNLSQSNCYLIIDLQNPTDLSVYESAKSLILSFNERFSECPIILLSTSVPDSGQFTKVLTPYPRSEWINWKSIQKDCQNIIFGDYGTVGLYQELAIDPKFIQISGKFKYTLEDNWYIAKGGLFKSNKADKSLGGVSVKPVLEAISKLPGFNPTHCSADTWIKERAEGTVDTKRYGNSATWITQAMLHHIETVLEQLAEL
ncbi:hypothetical protein [Bifidobacterium sp. ESL0704]|uniref:beta family protein n=1 Tax=Bifidobacterium sp. ESL0704 TaxID=2983219 RepID=UPI0023F63329|nr:hypothetical protein [Bifidobacterium sp. ESL0704]WEV52532.1 hypothetical protein OZX64_06495 [Bifidobacterium sp. ESL0704]